MRAVLRVRQLYVSVRRVWVLNRLLPVSYDVYLIAQQYGVSDVKVVQYRAALV